MFWWWARAVVWLTRGRAAGATADATHATRLDSQDREIGELKRRLEGISGSSELVVRLDERLKGLERTLREQPQLIAVCVGTAIKEALRVTLAPRRTN